MFGFLKKFFFTAMIFFSYNVWTLTSLKFVSVNNQECKIKSKIININNNKPLFFLHSIEVNKCSGSCNNINDPYSTLFAPNAVKKI